MFELDQGPNIYLFITRSNVIIVYILFYSSYLVTFLLSY